MEMLYGALFCLLFAMIAAYPHGPPTHNPNSTVCSDMFPSGHNVEPLNGVRDIFFALDVKPECYSAGSTVEITLYSTSDDESDFFEGLFIQARDAHTHKAHAYGTFSTNGDTDLTTHNCFGMEDSALSQSRADHYFKKTFHWMAGYDHQNDLVFITTVVHHTDQFWMNLTSSVIKYDPYCDQVIYPPNAAAEHTYASLLTTVLTGILALFI